MRFCRLYADVACASLYKIAYRDHVNKENPGTPFSEVTRVSPPPAEKEDGGSLGHFTKRLPPALCDGLHLAPRSRLPPWDP